MVAEGSAEEELMRFFTASHRNEEILAEVISLEPDFTSQTAMLGDLLEAAAAGGQPATAENTDRTAQGNDAPTLAKCDRRSKQAGVATGCDHATRQREEIAGSDAPANTRP